jgi:DNA polymerase-1
MSEFDQKSKILIVDGMNLIKRCYHGIPSRHNEEGMPTNIIYGFVRTLINEYNIFNCTGIITVFDTPTSSQGKKTFYPEYKGNRKALTEKELEDREIINEQIPHLKTVLRAAGVTLLSNKKYEADDLIATLAENLKKDNKVFILSRDNDLLQLVDDNVIIIRPGSQGKGKTVINTHTFKELYPDLISPAHIFDLKVIGGDPSDNIPGLNRVREKTALKILAQYRSLDNIEKNLSQLDSKTKVLFENGLNIIERNKVLVALDKNIEIPPDKVELKNIDFRTEEMKRLYSFYNADPWKD